MRKRIFTLMVAAIASVAAFAEKPNVEVKKTPVAITLDGAADEIWGGVTAVPIALPFDTAGDNKDVFATVSNCFWKACWNDDGIFVLVSVEDDSYWPSELSGGNSWEYDKPEIYFDVNETLEDGLGAMAGAASGHSQFAPTFLSTSEGAEQVDGEGDIARKFAHKVTGTNYVFEYFVPWAFLAQAENGIDKYRPIGFDVTVIDRDENSDLGRLRMVWSHNKTKGESWDNMDYVGTLTLTDDIIKVSVKTAKTAKTTVYINDNTLHNVNGNVSVYDVTGKLVLKAVANNSINVTALKPGVYVVKANNVTAKVVKR